jgi:hypothetical protein
MRRDGFLRAKCGTEDDGDGATMNSTVTIDRIDRQLPCSDISVSINLGTRITLSLLLAIALTEEAFGDEYLVDKYR